MTKRTAAVVATALALMLAAASILGAHEVRDSGVGVAIEIPEEMLAFLEDNGVDTTALAAGGSIPASVRKAILRLDADPDLRAEMNAIANRHLRETRMSTGGPAYLEVGPLYWGYWVSGDF
jgi:hypothetical protein